MSANGAMNDTDTDDAPEIVEPNETIEVDTSEDDAPAPEKRQTNGEVPKNRKERRSNEMREAREAREAAEKRAQAQEERASRVERELAEMRGYIAAQHQRQQQNPDNTVEKRVESLEDEANGHLEAAALAQQNKDPARAAREMRAYNAKLREATILAYEARSNSALDERFNRLQQSMPDPQAGAVIAQAAQEFPWLTTDREAEALANTMLANLLNSGRPRSIATVREACTAAAKRLGIGGRGGQAAPAQKARYTGVSNGEGGGGGSDPNRVVMGKPERAMAESWAKGMGLDLEAKEAHQAWAKMIAQSRGRGEE